MDVNAVNAVTREAVLTQLSHFKADLVERYAVSQIGVFGSVARQDTSPSSNIDIVVHMQPDMLKRACLKAELEDIFNCQVDVIRYWDGMNQYLKNRIDREAVYA